MRANTNKICYLGSKTQNVDIESSIVRIIRHHKGQIELCRISRFVELTEGGGCRIIRHLRKQFRTIRFSLYIAFFN